MVTAVFKVYGNSDDDIFEKDFEDIDAVINWWNEQTGHPYISYGLMVVKPKEKL